MVNMKCLEPTTCRFYDLGLMSSVMLCSFWVTVLRDISERGRELEQVLAQYITFVKPAFEEFCLPVSPVKKQHNTIFVDLLE